LIGLTATPRDEIDKNTFKLLELEDEPNFEYTFDEAVKDGYLVRYKAKRHNSKMINNGIKYDELTKEQRDELEKVARQNKAEAKFDKLSTKDLVLLVLDSMKVDALESQKEKVQNGSTEKEQEA
jgi:type I site-specific restriction endonuclease